MFRLQACADLTFSTSPGLPTAYVTYDRPNATDNSGESVTVNCVTNADGQTLSIGVYQATCVASETGDPPRLTDVFFFNITVKGKVKLRTPTC